MSTSDHLHRDEVEFSNFSAVDTGSQRYCTATLSFAINTVGAGIICLFGLVGNFLSFLVIGDDPKASAVTVFLLQSLAVADNFFLAVWLVQLLSSILYVLTDTHLQGP